MFFSPQVVPVLFPAALATVSTSGCEEEARASTILDCAMSPVEPAHSSQKSETIADDGD
jgi:hypothetical protein